MEIVFTFVDGLYAVKYADQSFDELERLLDEWTDSEFLTVFFDQHENDLIFFGLSKSRAVQETIKEANELTSFLIDKVGKSQVLLDDIFRPLNNLEYKVIELSQQKAKRRWLRLYAIKIEPGYYIITGGAIKLTYKMQDRKHTQNELDKLKQCKNYLASQGVFDLDSFNDLNF